MTFDRGELLAIHIGPEQNEPLVPRREVRAVEGAGLEGDRYYGIAGTKLPHEREVTLIESEALEALERDYGHVLSPAEARRNLLTRGVALNHLVGRDFDVGEVVLRGVRLCEPCTHLEALTKKKVRVGLFHRGGLRAQIVRGGVLRVGDRIETSRPPADEP